MRTRSSISFLSGRENLECSHECAGVDAKRIQEVIDLVDLTARIDDKVKTYSLGMRQRLGIAQAMLNNPRVLILDEPTNGLDPMGIRDLRLFIRRLVEETGLSVLVSSHILAEIELLADRVAIMSRGKIVKVGTVQALVDELASTIDLHIDNSFEVLPIVQGFEGIDHADIVDERTIRISMNVEESARLNRYLMERGVDVYGLERRVQTLEDLFITLTGVTTLSNPSIVGLIRNEVLKIHRKRRLLVVSIILIVLVSMFTYANYRQIEKQREEQGTIDWRVDLQQEIVDTQNRLASANVQDEFRQILEFQVQQNQYYLDNDINPTILGHRRLCASSSPRGRRSCCRYSSSC